MLTLTQLEYIVAVDKHRSFVEAAKACSVTQPSLSMQIQKLEKGLGVILFDRSRSPVVPTEAGRRIVDQAFLVLSEARRIQEMVNEAREEVAGDFKLGVIPTIAPYLLPLFLPRFMKKYPKVNLEIEEDKTERLLTQVEREEIDAAILAPPDDSKSQVMQKLLFHEPFCLYLSKEHPLFKKIDVKPNDLSLDDLLLLTEGHCLRDQVLELCHAQKGRTLFGVNPKFNSGNLQTLINLVELNMGYTLLPFLSARLLCTDAQKAMVRQFVAPVPVRKVSLIYNRAYLKRQMIDSLVKEIQASLPEELHYTVQSHYVVPLK